MPFENMIFRAKHFAVEVRSGGLVLSYSDETGQSLAVFLHKSDLPVYAQGVIAAAQESGLQLAAGHK